MMKRADARSKFGVSLTGLLAGALLWGTVCAFLLVARLWQLDRLGSVHTPLLLGVYALGGTAGWCGAALCLRYLRQRTSKTWLLALAAAALLLAATLGFTAGLFALHYRSFYAQWHAEAFTRDWVLQFLFTSASAVYQFLVIGLRLYGMLFLPAILGASAILVRSMR